LKGFAQHWDKNSNWAAHADQWFMNLFPRPKPFVFNGGGYLTFSFIPTLGTMILGLIAGNWMRASIAPSERIKKLLVAGVIGLVLGAALHFAGICPLVKRIWTPTWTIFSGGCAFLFLALFYAVIDVKGWKKWSFPLVVIGMNSIAAYCLAHLIEGFIVSSFKTHLGQNFFQSFGEIAAPFFQGSMILLTLWLILFWMHQRKIFLRI
jgi:heparan-alpha-glucosaminide N-acetyltransferase